VTKTSTGELALQVISRGTSTAAPLATSLAGCSIWTSRNSPPEEKAIAYYWADGPGSELPPGHWAMIAQAASRAGGLSLDANAKGFFAFANGTAAG
jgi:hypothetical protein